MTPPHTPLSRMRPGGYTVMELLVVTALLSLALAVATVHFRQRKPTVGALAANLSFHMQVRQANDQLTERLLEATEVLKPSPGYSLDYLVVADLANRPQVYFLEKAERKEDGPFILVLGSGAFGSTTESQRRILCRNVKQISFTTITPGQVTVVVTFLDPNGKELSSLLQIPLKNVSSGSG